MLKDMINKTKLPIGITHLAGPPNSGKTTIIYQMCKNIKNEEKVLIFDCEMNFSAQRLKEITFSENIDLNNIIVIPISDKTQQFQTLMKVHNFIKNTKLSFIAVNGITDHYRFKDIKINDIANQRLLAFQMAYLQKISKKNRVRILITNQASPYRENNQTFMRPVYNSTISNYIQEEVLLYHVNRRLWKGKHNSEEIYYTLSEKGIKLIEE